MRRSGIFIVVGLLCLGFVSSAASQEKKQEKQKKESISPAARQLESTDITAEVQRMNNSEKFAGPPVPVRPGKVVPRVQDVGTFKDTAKGFTIQLPSKAPIPTPTVYKGKIYVSGGFQSREFYCFDAVSGKLVWAVDLDDDGPTSAVCENDICVFNTESCTIFALNAATGEYKWSHWLGDPLTSTPTIANGKVFTSYPADGGGPDNLFDGKLDQKMPLLANGKKLLKDQPAVPGAPLPNPADELAKAEEKKKGSKSKDKTKDLAKDKDAGDAKKSDVKQPQGLQRPDATHVLACLDLKTGDILWQKWIDSDVMSAPVAVYGDVYVTSFAGTVYRFSQQNGAILSSQRTRATSAPVVVGSNVYMTKRADSGKGEKVQEQITSVNLGLADSVYFTTPQDAKYLDERVQANSKLDVEGKLMDKFNGFGGGAPAAANPMAAQKNVGQANVSTMQSFQGSRILNFQNGNFNCMGNEVNCTDPATGAFKWRLPVGKESDLVKLGGFLASPPAAAGGNLFLATVQGEVLRLDPVKGTILETYKVHSPVRSQPAIEGGRIYVGTQDGKVVCIDTGNRQFTGWSTWGANAAHTNVVESNAKAR